MRYLLVNSNRETASGSTGSGGTIQVQSNQGPKFTLALLVLVGICALIGVAWLFFRLFRICKPQRPQLRVPSATISGGLTPHGRAGIAHLRSSASLSGPFADLERNDTADSLTIVERSDSMVMRASAWARAILSGETNLPPPPPLLSLQHPSASTNAKSWDTVSIPVKQAIVIMQPDGEATLGISEATQRDVMVQVDEEDLFRESNTATTSGDNGSDGSNSSGIMNTSTSAGPSTTTRSHQQRHQQRQTSTSQNNFRRDTLVDEASQCSGLNSRDSSRSQLAGATSSDLLTPPSEDELNSGTSTSFLPIEQQQDQQQGEDGEEDRSRGEHRHRRRRRKRRKGTCEASCQTEESSLN